MVSTPVRFWARPAAAVSGGAVMVCFVGAWHSPISTDLAHAAGLHPTSSATAVASTARVQLVANLMALPSAWPAAGGLGGGPGGGPGGGSDGSAGDAVAPSPSRHQSNGGSGSGGSGGSDSDGSASRGSGPVGAAFKTVGRWLGLSDDDSASSGDSAERDHPARGPRTDRASAASDQDSSAGAPKRVKPAASSDGAGEDESSTASSGSGVGDMIHSVISGVGRLIGGLFGR
jgi:hypothetical protein